MKLHFFALTVLLLAAARVEAGLVNHYTFNDGNASDPVGGKHGTLVNGGAFTSAGLSGLLDLT
jgi:hypothetical protein